MNDERQTPRWLFDLLQEKFSFTVDAAASESNALLPRYWTKENNGLEQSWTGETVWCNPPYSRGQCLLWVQKAFHESAGAKIVMLLPGDCSTKTGQFVLRKADAVLFLNRRLSFDQEKSGAKFCSWVALFGGGYEDKNALFSLNLGVVEFRVVIPKSNNV